MQDLQKSLEDGVKFSAVDIVVEKYMENFAAWSNLLLSRSAKSSKYDAIEAVHR